MNESPSPAPIAARGTVRLRIAGMDCAAEESEIRRALETIGGIRSLGFQLGAQSLTIDAPPEAIDAAIAAIRAAGFRAEPLRDEPSAEPAPRRFGGIVRLLLALALAVLAELIALLLPTADGGRWAEMAIAAAAIALSGFDTYRRGLSALRHGKLNITALMSVAVTGAFLIGQWPEAAMVMALYAIAELIEARALDRARNAIRSLMALAPKEALVRQADGSWTTMAVDTVPLQALVRIRPGARVPLDGIVTAGTSAVDQAPITGESLPVDKSVGDPLLAGTINQEGELEARVTATAGDTTLARIIHAVEQAQGARAPTQRFVDRFAAVYTPTVFVIALLVAVVTPVLLGWTWEQALYKSLVLLVIACPCALVISTPVTVVSALTRAAQRGVLIKGGTYLEDARRLRAIALDKTGTITEGKPRLVDHTALAEASMTSPLEIAAGLAARSDHPVSRAIAAGLGAGATPISDFQALAGRGVQGRVADRVHVLGNHRLIHERGQCSAELEASIEQQQQLGRTVTLLASDDAVQALFAVADTTKDSSRAAIAELRALGVTPVMLTGDNAATGRVIAAQAGIDEVHGDLLPENKLRAVEDLRARYGPTAMVGDGINDAPALARADIGIAMGAAGTDTAVETADVVIMNDDLRSIPFVIRLSRRTHDVMWQNISIALGIKAVFLILAVLGKATMWMAVFADMGASLLVVANGLRLLRAP
ncbi:heavy metal translocating P-type ATPase [Solimonas variicoloris]|uniref:heavy metal translocating P-type ATPase n=1 Tax=Solimonas variicoloris TaxID=254408 RepID=UPI00035E43B9|nr:heavy metal translocating P-type ATPase [Solimonas variicoloris]